ncbi:tRNA lysidine(34) synthetase TilS [Ursidibacter maritimus]|uniref:tRNA(Ile)-lysidine synthase n=1 Tax=Ursidibacter maritimus TaxID=1331689 RepID=A0A949T583_9PAST|nr:tRNA lysidine(34) synthetase TilS [Ursidibacter maritimus]KAE9540165.1 tRNA(Ile)-lysidine synthase [Ursidibacter maritimus]MBV6523786.1 tRNA lysidine(34) synthetase TilS [Ursidibacter maritimus]MBV6526296.1 tRNA lysidine(34) synthetase TilS [Ursidibacter maritimus]MBV6527858.1 tRNA lysidine(34) synthetase TilS [Ursidibacter maritimus]MBV6529189.1 tRNA lysidine(34) synthetase TilS [Ursidibacter maritimus]
MLISTLRQQLAIHTPQQTDFLIGLSGGVDSVVLLHLLCQLRQENPLNLRAIHIHHGLSSNADSWAEFCQHLCGEWQVPLTVCKVNVSGKQGIEANARQARYQAIAQHIQPNEMLVTAHHLDDQVETFFLALKRGSGITGLSAMKTVSSWGKEMWEENARNNTLQEFTIFRPLLTSPKSAIQAYAVTHCLEWINDESNADSRYERNFLRNDILPLLNQRWQQFDQMVARAAQHCAEQQQLVEELLNDELHARLNLAERRFNIEEFNQLSHLKQQQLIRLWLEKCQMPMPSQIQLEQIITNVIFAEQDKNPEFRLADKMLRRYQKHLFITEIFADTPPFEQMLLAKQADEFTLPENIGTLVRTSDALIFRKKSGQTHRLLLPTALQQEPLTIKLNYRGKVPLYPHSKREEMKKIWQKNNVPVWERTRTPLVFFNQQLVAVLTTP